MQLPADLLELEGPATRGQSGSSADLAVPPRQLVIGQLLHSLNVGGAEILACRLARRLRNRFRFVFYCLDDVGPLGHDLQADGFHVQWIKRSPGWDWSCPRRLARVFREQKVDVIHAHQYTPFVYGMAARWWGHRRPILFTEHGRHQPDYPRLKRKIVNRLLLSRQDRIVGVGKAVRTALIDNEGFTPVRVAVIYNGVDVDQFAAARDRDAARREMGVAPDEFVMIQVARLDYLKDHLTAVRMLARLKNGRQRCRLVLVGDGPERTPIEKEAKALQVTDRIVFLGNRQDVSSLLCGADVFLLTSISEGIPLTVLEAMSSGLAIVATDVGGLAEIVEAGSTGLLAPARDDAALAEAVVSLVDNPVLRQNMGQAGRQRAMHLFDEARMSEEYARLYLEQAPVC